MTDGNRRLSQASRVEIKNELGTLEIHGRWPLPEISRVAVVGTRRATPYGEAVAHDLGRGLANAGVQVVSGLGLGTETAVQEGVLEGGGRAVVVFGSALDVLYSGAPGGLARRIVQLGGTLVSDVSPDESSRPNLPRRDALIVALSDVVVLTEADDGSRAMITAEAAVRAGKRVMAVPGSIFSSRSGGCHRLLRNGAGIVVSIQDILAELNQLGARRTPSPRIAPPTQL